MSRLLLPLAICLLALTANDLARAERPPWSDIGPGESLTLGGRGTFDTSIDIVGGQLSIHSPFSTPTKLTLNSLCIGERGRLIVRDRSNLRFQGSASVPEGIIRLDGTGFLQCFHDLSLGRLGGAFAKSLTRLEVGRNLTLNGFASLRTLNQVRIGGDYHQSGAGYLQLRARPKIKTAHISINGKAHLDGTLEVDTRPLLQEGGSVTLLQADQGISGEFKEVILPERGFQINYSRTKVILERIKSPSN
jgi:hypothetical protein